MSIPLRIAIVGGKGGTKKTGLAASLFALAEKAAVAEAQVKKMAVIDNGDEQS